MANEILKRDENRITVLGAVTDDANQFITQLRVNPTNNRLKVSATGLAPTAAQIAAHIKVDTFTTTSGQTVFTPSQILVSNMLFIMNGVPQTPTVDYTLTTNITLNTGVPAGLPAIWIYIY